MDIVWWPTVTCSCAMCDDFCTWFPKTLRQPCCELKTTFHSTDLSFNVISMVYKRTDPGKLLSINLFKHKQYPQNRTIYFCSSLWFGLLPQNLTVGLTLCVGVSRNSIGLASFLPNLRNRWKQYASWCGGIYVFCIFWLECFPHRQGIWVQR